MSLKDVVRRAGGQPLASYRRRRQQPVLSVVMPVYNVAAYLPAALDSALSQSFKELEVIAVDDGSTDDSARILRDYARRDYRVQVLEQPNAGQGVARNLGVASARGEFLTFLDSDDVVPLDAYQVMVARLRASGSDFSVGNLRRLRDGQLQRIIWSRTVHRQDRIGTTIEEFPDAMQDIIACNRMFRTAFWREQVGDFQGGIAYEDHVPMLTAYVRARAFDVLQKVTYHWRIREDLTSTGQQKARIANLRDRITVKDEAHRLLQAEASEAVYAAWVGRTLEVDFPPFLPFALSGDDDFRALLASTYRTYLDRATPEALRQVRVAMRVRAHLAALERWDDLFDADDWFRQVQNMPPTKVEGGRLVADFPSSCTWADALPDDQSWMAPVECHFEGAVEHLAWSSEELRITGWAWLRGLDLHAPVVSARLVADDEEMPLQVRSLRLPEADQWSPLSFASPAAGGFEATVPLQSLGQHSWSLVVEVEQDGLTASGAVHHRVARSAAVAASAGGPGWAVRWDGTRGLTLAPSSSAAKAPAPAVVDVALAGTRLTARIDGEVGSAELVADGSRLPMSVSGSQVEVELADSGRAVPSGSYELVVDGEPVALDPSYAGAAPHRLVGDDVHVQVGQRADRRALLVVGPPLRDDEQGRVNVHRQRTRYQRLGTPFTDSVLLGSVEGRAASGDQLAMDRWLAAHRPDVQRLWGVADRSVAVPPGSVGILRGSREWYDALATSRLVSHDEDLGPWVSRRHGQRLLRTFAVRPSAPLGVEAWRRDGLIEHLVERELRHRQREWDVLLAPDEDAATLLHEAFRWEGEVIVAGSPRTDRLVAADRDAVREEVLRDLGLPEHRHDTTLVLHAPAPRDARDIAVADGVEGLDVAALARQLGPGFTVLRRTDPADRRPPPDLTGVVDVSHYPDVTTLLVAADVAVLDYSGIRFDWALTGRPMVFHVPDLVQWSRSRRSSISWEDTAPGPWVHAAAGVAACVLEATTLQESHAEQLARFNTRFNSLNDGHATERVMGQLLD